MQPGDTEIQFILSLTPLHFLSLSFISFRYRCQPSCAEAGHGLLVWADLTIEVKMIR